jgi:putative ABC transport system permease protein
MRILNLELIGFAWKAVKSHKLRSGLTILGIVIGISSVVLLSSIGEGVRHHIMDQFTQLGTNCLTVLPGKVETWGIPGFLGGAPRKLTLEDVRALRRIPGVEAITPVVWGKGLVKWAHRGRHVYVWGVTSEVHDVWDLPVRSGHKLPSGDPYRSPPFCVLGPTLRQEIFGATNALGQHVRIGQTKFRVIGIMESKGQFLGTDIDDAAYIPVSYALRLFNQEGLSEIDIKARATYEVKSLAEEVRQIMRARHGEEDFTVITQDAVLDAFNKIMRVATYFAVAIAAISIFVGAIGILTIQWVAVHERTPEIGLEKALGAERSQILLHFLLEAVILSVSGGFIGIVTGLLGTGAITIIIPELPTKVPYEVLFIAVVISLLVGLGSGILPAYRAARLDPVEALRME